MQQREETRTFLPVGSTEIEIKGKRLSKILRCCSECSIRKPKDLDYSRFCMAWSNGYLQTQLVLSSFIKWGLLSLILLVFLWEPKCWSVDGSEYLLSTVSKMYHGMLGIGRGLQRLSISLWLWFSKIFQ